MWCPLERELLLHAQLSRGVEELPLPLVESGDGLLAGDDVDEIVGLEQQPGAHPDSDGLHLGASVRLQDAGDGVLRSPRHLEARRGRVGPDEPGHQAGVAAGGIDRAEHRAGRERDSFAGLVHNRCLLAN